MTHPTIGTVAMGDDKIQTVASRIVQAACELDHFPDPDDDDTLIITVQDLDAVIVNHITAALSRPAHAPVASFLPTEDGEYNGNNEQEHTGTVAMGDTGAMIEAARQELLYWDFIVPKDIISCALNAALSSRPAQEAVAWIGSDTLERLNAIHDMRAGFIAGEICNEKWGERFNIALYAAPQPVLSQPEVKALAPVDVYKVLKRASDNGRLSLDYISNLSREIAALTLSHIGEEGK